MGKGGGGAGGAGKNAMAASQGFWGPSAKPRRMMFRQLASALATGGRGMRMPFAQQAMVRSQAAGNAALRGADTTLAGIDPSIRSRVLNRIMQQSRGVTNAIPVNIASKLIESAPDAVINQGKPISAGFANVAQGMGHAMQAQATRLEGFARGAQSLGEGIGSAAGSAGGSGGWFDRYFKSREGTT